MFINSVGFICSLIYRCIENKRKIRDFTYNSLELTTKELFQLVSYYKYRHDFKGAYIICNKTKNNSCYVGQSKNVLNRVINHFKGQGNQEVYFDYKIGNIYTIKGIALQNSGFSSLNELERSLIQKYNPYELGYNKTRGNR